MDHFELIMSNISLEFPGVMAIKDTSFTIRNNEVHALIGANGAGKSSMMKVLSGYYTHWKGNMSLNGAAIEVRSIQDAKNLGIETVYQEVDVALIPTLSVAENIMIDYFTQDMAGKSFISWPKMKRMAQDILNTMNIDIDINIRIEDCSLAQKQLILIARSVSRDCKVLVLDEPTAPLSHTEAQELFRIVKVLKTKGVSIVFISHRLPEIFEICDHITIMRDGVSVTDKVLSQTSEKEVVELMLGRTFESSFPKHSVEVGEMVFKLENLSDDRILNNISMEVNRGEIVGIAGLVGAGKTELCKAMFGVENIVSGKIMKHGQPIDIKNPGIAVENGIAFVPEERRKEGVIIDESVLKNLTMASLKQFSKFGFVNRNLEKHYANEMIEKLSIKTKGSSQIVEDLSGGNQQKVVVGKWLLSDADLFIFDEPTKGVDIGAKKDMFELVGELVQEGKSVIYASCENNELLGITDRIYIMYSGRIVKEVITSETSEDELLFYSAGGLDYEKQRNEI